MSDKSQEAKTSFILEQIDRIEKITNLRQYLKQRNA